MSSLGKLITLEGIEGVGKSTVSRFIVQYLSKHISQEIVQTREPGGTPLAEKIRDLAIKTTDEIVYPDTELLLMFAARAQHVQKVILPALISGKWVVSDRFIDASYAYQGAGRGIDFQKIAILEKLVLGDLRPDLVIILDAPVEVGMARAQQRGAPDRFEAERSEFFERVRQSYLQRAANDPSRYSIVDATRAIPEVESQLRTILQPWIKQS
jgi:dTMP kinase